MHEQLFKRAMQLAQKYSVETVVFARSEDATRESRTQLAKARRK